MTVCNYLLLSLFQEIKQYELRFQGGTNHTINRRLFEVHGFENLLENIVNDITKDESVVNIWILPLELIRKEGAASTRKGFYYLSSSYQNVRLNNQHGRFMISLILFIVIQSQSKIVFWRKLSDNSNEISYFGMQLICPLTSDPKGESKVTLNPSRVWNHTTLGI